MVYGDLDAENFLHLYKTDLDVKEGSEMELTFQKVSDDDASMKLGVIFADNTNTVVEFDIADTVEKSDGWVTSTVDLSGYAGKKIAAFGLVFEGEADGYQMNVGEIRLTDGEDNTPDAPENLSIRAGYENGEMTLDWELDDYSNVDKYNVYVVGEDGTRSCMGGTYDDVYYIKDTLAKGDITVEVTAVGKDGSESEPAAVEYSYSENVSNLQVEESLDATGMTMQAANAGYLDISFTKPAVEYKELLLEVKLLYTEDDTTYTMTVDNQSDSARFYIPRGHGEYYDLFVTTVFEDGSKSEPAAYRGRLRDVWSQPLTEKDVEVNKDGTIGLISPTSVDWNKAYFYADGVKFHEATRGERIRDGVAIPEGATTVDIVLEDYSGNLSEPLTVSVSYVTNAVGKLDETTVPDAVLRQAMIEQIGSDSIEDARPFTGTLDFTGLDIHSVEGLALASHAQEIILSGTPIDTIAAGAIGFYVQKVDLSNCKQLRIVDPAAFDGAVALREVDITGCDALELLAITDSSVEKLTYGDVKAFPNLIRLDLSGSCFDLSEGTPEALFVEQIQSQVSEDKSVDVISPNTVNIAPDATLIAEQSSDGAESIFSGLIDGNTSSVRTADLPLTMVLDFGTELTVSGWEFTCNSLGGLADYVISTSVDGQTYETFSTIEGNEEAVVSFTADSPVKARYMKLEATMDYGFLGAAVSEWGIYGNPVVSYPSEVICDSQTPRLVPQMDMDIAVEKADGESLDLAGLLETAMENASAQTIRGTTAEELADADFLADSYSSFFSCFTTKEVGTHTFVSVYFHFTGAASF